MPQHFKVLGISSTEAAVIAASDLTHTLLHPTSATLFQQPGSNRMQAIKELAEKFDKMTAPHEPTPRVTTVTGNAAQHAPQVPPPRVLMLVPNIRCSPRQHQPAIISQEERAYQLLSTPPPRIKQAHTVTYQLTGQQLEYRHLLKRPDLRLAWEKAFANKLCRIAQGIRDIKGKDQVELITHAQIPRYRQITRLVCNIRPHKAEPHRFRLTVGGNRIDYPGETVTKNANLTTSKCLWNSTISTNDARYMCADVKKNISTPSSTDQNS
jgi:hypothetical protein